MEVRGEVVEVLGDGKDTEVFGINSLEELLLAKRLLFGEIKLFLGDLAVDIPVGGSTMGDLRGPGDLNGDFRDDIGDCFSTLI